MPDMPDITHINRDRGAYVVKVGTDKASWEAYIDGRRLGTYPNKTEAMGAVNRGLGVANR